MIVKILHDLTPLPPMPEPKYSIISYGQNPKKPPDLKGIKSFASVDFIPGKCKCQLFLKGNDLYIKHNDYFSPSFRAPGRDNELPLGELCKKYLGKEKREKFIYPDGWGDIVLRRRAWILITNFADMVERMIPPEIAWKTWELVAAYHHWEAEDVNGDMERFFERVARTTKKYLEGTI